jgi:hypothetical protein
MSSRRLKKRLSSATVVGPGALEGHRLAFHKVSTKDGSAKCDIVESRSEQVLGVLFEIDETEKPTLDGLEGLGNGYDDKIVEIRLRSGAGCRAFTYFATNIDPGLKPFSWYMRHVLEGAREAGLPPTYIGFLENVDTIEDPNEGRKSRELAIYRCSRA